ncbi:UDP-glucose 6-dehydrogenase [Pragia fontium]|nr:UDP-glucose 6-dehydrogenase [Pragia fontium]
MKITIVGMGYVGLSNALLLSQYNEVVVLDISVQKVALLNQKISPIDDEGVKAYLAKTNKL